MDNKLKETFQNVTRKLVSFFKKHPIMLPPIIVAISTMIIGLILHFSVRISKNAIEMYLIKNGKFNPLIWLTDIRFIWISLKIFPIRSSLVLAAVTFVIALMFSVKYYASRDIYKTARVTTKQMMQEELAQNSAVIEKNESERNDVIEVEAEVSQALPKTDNLVQSETSDVTTDMSIF